MVHDVRRDGGDPFHHLFDAATFDVNFMGDAERIALLLADQRAERIHVEIDADDNGQSVVKHERTNVLPAIERERERTLCLRSCRPIAIQQTCAIVVVKVHQRTDILLTQGLIRVVANGEQHTPSVLRQRHKVSVVIKHELILDPAFARVARVQDLRRDVVLAVCISQTRQQYLTGTRINFRCLIDERIRVFRRSESVVVRIARHMPHVSEVLFAARPIRCAVLPIHRMLLAVVGVVFNRLVAQL